MKKLFAIIAIGIGCYLLTGLYQIRPEERAVVRRFGRVISNPGPGLWIGFPYGIDRVDRVPTATVRRVTVGYQPDSNEENPTGQFLSGDQNLVNVQIAIDYSVGDESAELIDYVMMKDRVDGIVQRLTETVTAEWIAGKTIDEVLLSGNTTLPGILTKNVDKRLANQHLGIRIQQASVVFATPPDEVRSAFEEVTAAQTNARSQEQKAQQEANRLLREADSQRFQHEQQAIGYASSKKAIAKGEADGFLKRLEQYRKLKSTNPDVLTAIWWDEMSRTWLSFRNRGRVELLDSYLGPDGLDLTHIVPPRKK